MRSLLRQLEQIRRSATYDDAVSGIYTSAVAEPTVSGSLEQDLNVIRSLMKEMKGTSDWFGDLGNYFDPSNTDNLGTENKDLNLTNIKNNTLDAKTVILAVSDDNSGAGYTVSGTSTGVLLSLTTAYATPADRRGLPIFASTANNGSYHDEGGLDRVVRVDVINMATGAEMQDTNGNTIYAKFHDGADFSGTGTGTDVYARFYANGVVSDLSIVEGGAPSSIAFVYPQRKLMSSMAEYEWLRTDFVSSWEGDVELIEDIHNIWSFTGASDNDGAATPWDNTTGNYLLNGNPSSLKSAIDALNTGIGNATYTEDNYVTDGQDITASVDALDMATKDAADAASAAQSTADGAASAASAAQSTADGAVSDAAAAQSTADGAASAAAANATDISDLEAALGSSTGLAGMDYTSTNYLTVDTTVIAALSTLDTELKSVSDSLDASSGAKYVESVTVQIDQNTEHTLPSSLTYTPTSTAGQEGANMDVYVDGQLLAADTGVNGANADRDYGETSASGITFRFDVQVGRNITYIIKQ